MFPNPWATPVPPPVVTKPIVYKNSTPTPYPYYAAPTAIQNISMNPQTSLPLNATSVLAHSLQPNAIDPAMVQKWQEWKQWEAWQQQFQQWQQQTGQITATPMQPAPPSMPPSQPIQPLQTPIMQYQSQQYPYNQPRPPLPIINDVPLQQQTNFKIEVGMKRGLEPEFHNNEKKLKIDTATNKKEIELTDETEGLFEEQFKSWEEQFVKWKEQNKSHPDKIQYLEYEKKWISWRDHLKQKCEVLKKKRELKMAEKKKEMIQVEENKLQSQQRLGYNTLMQNSTTSTNVLPPLTLQHLQNKNASMVPPTSENHIPGLDLVTNNEYNTGGFLNVSRILPQNLTVPIQTPDDKPFNFPKSNTTSLDINKQSVNMPPSSMHQPATSMYQNSSSWSKYNNPVSYYDKTSVDVNAAPVSIFGQQNDKFGQQNDTFGQQNDRFGQKNDKSDRPPYDEEMSNVSSYNNSTNATNYMSYRRPLEGSYNNPPLNESSSTMYNKGPADDQLYSRNFSTPNSSFRGYQLNTSVINNNFIRPPEIIPYQHQKPLLNLLSSKPPSLLSLNVAKPIKIDKSENYMENTNDVPNRYERNWNVADEEDDPENEYMEAHKKFSSEPFDDQNDEDQFSNNKHGNSYYDKNNYSRGQQGPAKNYNDDYPRSSLNQPRGSQLPRNMDIEYPRPNSQFTKNINEKYPHDLQTSKNKNDDYFKPANNIRTMDSGFSRKAPTLIGEDNGYRSEPVVDKNKFVSPKGNYRPPTRGNYEPSRGNFGNNTNKTSMEWDKKEYNENEVSQQPVKDIVVPSPGKQPATDSSPIDPVKIFDYRHLSALKVIPGLSKETVIPIRVYDYKHGGKRILPWQDRGFSRRNSNHPRDLNEKEGFLYNANDKDKNKGTSTKKPSFRSQDTDVNDKNVLKNKVKETSTKIDEIIDISIDDAPITLDTITIVDDDDGNVAKAEILQPNNKTNDIHVSSPPKVSQIKEVAKQLPRQLLSIDTLLSPPGRQNRPAKIVIIIRGLPGSGKSYVAKLIKEKEVAMGGQAPRILSLDDYFMTEVTKTEINPETNKKVEKKVMEYEHDSAMESVYRTSFIKAFKKKMVENFFSFYIIDAINNKVAYYRDIIDISRLNGFTVYIIELEADVDLCIKRNIHNRTADDINNLMSCWVKTPDNQILLDIQSLLNSSSKSEMEIEDVSDNEMDLEKDEDEKVDEDDKINEDDKVDEDDKDDGDIEPEENKNVDFEEEDIMKLLSCKWVDSIPQEEKMNRLDGLCKKKPEKSIKEWLQIPEDNYTDSEEVDVKDGKKRVRWADMEERREQEKMRAIGFVVGQTDWNRMLGRDQGESKLTQTKYI